MLGCGCRASIGAGFAPRLAHDVTHGRTIAATTSPHRFVREFEVFMVVLHSTLPVVVADEAGGLMIQQISLFNDCGRANPSPFVTKC